MGVAATKCCANGEQTTGKDERGAEPTVLESPADSGSSSVQVKKSNTIDISQKTDGNATQDSAEQSGDHPMFESARTGNQDAMQEVLGNAGVNLELRSSEGSTALELAVANGHVSIASMLVKAGAETTALGQKLVTACSEPDLEQARFYLHCGAHPDTRNEDGATLLLHAVDMKLLDLARLLLENGADEEGGFGEGESARTPLLCAAATGQLDMANLLLEHEADEEALNDQGRTPLLMAVANGHLEIANMLIGRGVSRQVADKEGDNVVSLAVKQGNPEIAQLMISMADHKELGALSKQLLEACIASDWEKVKLLLACNVSADVTNTEGKRPLLVAIDKGKLDMMKLLMKGASKADKEALNKKIVAAVAKGNTKQLSNLLACGMNKETKDTAGRTLLLSAVMHNHAEAAKVLIQNKANKEARDKDGKTALALATEKGHSELVKLLVSKGASKAVLGDIGKALLEAAQKGDASKVEILILCGASTGAQDDFKLTALHKACSAGRSDIAKILLDAGASIDALGGDFGCTPFYDAVRSGNQEMAKFLLDRGADKDARSRKLTDSPLHQAATQGHIELCTLLLQSKADLEAQDRDSETPLHRAARYDKPKCVEFLVKSGAKKDAQDSKGKTPKDVGKDSCKRFL